MVKGMDVAQQEKLYNLLHARLRSLRKGITLPGETATIALYNMVLEDEIAACQDLLIKMCPYLTDEPPVKLIYSWEST